MSAFSGKTAIVTGGASGIGKAIGEALAARGARVVLADVDDEKCGAAADGIRARGGAAEAVHLDVVDGPAVHALVERTARDRGGLDYMFNNAGIAIIGDALENTTEDWSRLIDVNIRGVVHGVQAAYAVMAKRGSGHIVNTASVAGLMPFPQLTGYVMTKHAVVGLSTSLRLEAARYGVRVSVVCPGLIDTGMKHTAKLIGADREKVMARMPAFTSAEDCASAVLDGVRANRAVIVVTGLGKTMSTAYRLLPAPMRWLIGHVTERERAKMMGER